MVFPSLSPKDSWAKQQHVLVECGTHGCSCAGQHSEEAANAFLGNLHPSRQESTAGRRKKNPCCCSTNFIH